MCDWCYEHAGKPWYLIKRFHDIETAPIWRKLAWRLMMGSSFVEDSLKALENKVEPYGWLIRKFYMFVTRNIFGAQVVARLKEALQIIDTANDIFLHYCNYKRCLHPEHPKDYRCIFLNHTAQYERTHRPETRDI